MSPLSPPLWYREVHSSSSVAELFVSGKARMGYIPDHKYRLIWEINMEHYYKHL